MITRIKIAAMSKFRQSEKQYSNTKKLFVFLSVALAFFMSPGFAAAAANVYHSVSPFGTGNLLSGGSPTIVVDASGNATLTLGGATQVTNIGQGTVVEYNSRTSYIDSITDATHFHLITSTGANAASQTSTAVTSIHHEYASLSAAEDALDQDLTSSDLMMNIACYYDHDDQTADTNVVFAGWTTDATRYVRVYTPTGGTQSIYSQRHSGKWSDNKYKIETTVYNSFYVTGAKYIHVDGIQISHTPPDGGYPRIFYATFNDANSNVRLSNSVMKADYSALPATPYYARTIFFYGTTGGDIRARVWNNLLYYTAAPGNTNGSSSVGITAGTLYAYNNTIINYAASPGSGLYCATEAASYVYAYNNIVKGFGDTNTYAISGCTLSGNYNSTDSTDTTGQGANSRISQTFSFIDEAGYDFRLAPTDAGARNRGTNLSSDSNLSFSTDLEGDSRTVGQWDIGADEYTENGAFTLSAWVRPTGTSAASKAIIAKAEEVRLVTDGSGNPLCQVKSGGAWQTAAVSSAALALNEWAYVACAYNRSTLKVYVNGIQKDSDSLSVGIDNTSASLKFGADDSGGTTYADFQGFMDEVRMYPYARSAAQIRADYNAGSAGMSAQKGVTLALGGGEPKWMSDGLVGYWRMDESSWNGTSGEVIDSSGNANHGTSAGGATTDVGKFGKGGVFDGTDDYVNTGSASSLDNIETQGGGGITVSAWVYARSYGENNNGYIVSKGSMNMDGHWRLMFAGVANWLLFSKDYDGANNLSVFVDYPTSYFNTWKHVTATWDGSASASNMHIYIDGVEASKTSTSDGTGSKLSDESRFVAIGASDDYGSGGYTFDGKIDEVRIYNRAFGADDINNLFQWNPKPTVHIKMDEKVIGDAQTLYDASGYQRNATTEQGSNSSGMDCSQRGRYGSSCDLDGTDDYMQINDFDY